jgi:branched-chain amino acid transport system substrate-binding protein
LGLSGCRKEKRQKFTIGVLSPKTGADSQPGLSCERGAKISELFFKDVFGDFDILHADTESSVDIGRTKAEKLIHEGAHVLVGAHNSGVTAAIAQVCEQNKVPLVINVSAAPKLTEQGYQYTFRNFLTTDSLSRQGLALMKQLFEEKGSFPQKAALMHVNDTYGQAMKESLLKNLALTQMPFQLCEVVTYDGRTQDLSSEIGRIQESGADLLIPISRLNDAILMVRECIKHRYNPMGIISPGSPGMYEKQFFRILGHHANHCITNTSWYNKASSLTQGLLGVFENLYPDESFDLNVSFTVEAILIALNAHKITQSLNGEDLRQAISQTHISERVVYGGPITFDAKGQGQNIFSVALQNRDGRPYVVLPQTIQETHSIFPTPEWRNLGGSKSNE